jgi:oxygen-independent coproporphyrinogen-3 oxidase
LYLGGGTPSELTGDEIEDIVNSVTANFSFVPSTEWTIECNPGTVNPATCDRLLELGFDRISLGTQSFDNDLLLKLGRIHSADDSVQTFRRCRNAGFENINLDLIFGVPGQTLETWLRDLRTAINLGPEHLAIYGLTVEPGTNLAERIERGQLSIPPDDLQAEMFEVAMDLTDRAGYSQYEISNYSLPGFESIHNLSYWTNADYMGFGVSASSFIDGVRWSNTSDWNEYMSSALKGSVLRNGEERLEGLAAAGEEIMMRLRTRDGICLDSLSEKYSTDCHSQFSDSIQFLVTEGLLVQAESRLCLSRRGKLLASEVCKEFLQL